MAVSSVGEIRLPQKTLKPECRHVESMAINSFVIFPLFRSILNTLCRKMASSFFSSRGGATKEHAAITIKTAVGHQDVAVGIESEKIAEGLDSDDGAGDGIKETPCCKVSPRILDKNLQGFPGAAAEGGNKFSIIQKVASKNLRDTEDKMPVRNLLEDIHAEPLPKFHHALLIP